MLIQRQDNFQSCTVWVQTTAFYGEYVSNVVRVNIRLGQQVVYLVVLRAD